MKQDVQPKKHSFPHPKNYFISRLLEIFSAPLTITHVVIALLLLAFGFSMVNQISTSRENTLDRLSESELVSLLDDLHTRTDKLSQERYELENQLRQIKSSAGSEQEARKAAEERARILAIMSGTTPVSGEGVEISVSDQQRKLPADVFVNLLGELRNAGAEAVDISGQRVTLSTWIEKRGDDLLVDGKPVKPPYRIIVLGDSHTLAVALGIPGGAISRFKQFDSSVTVVEKDNLEITSVRQPTSPKWAKVVKE